MPTPIYDWITDPKAYKTPDGHVPKHRCFHCASKFMGSSYAAFCNICDNEMSPDKDDQTMFVVTDKANKEGYMITRREFVANRIRIPEDTTEEEYKKKLEEPPVKHKAVFTRADDLVDMME